MPSHPEPARALRRLALGAWFAAGTAFAADCPPADSILRQMEAAHRLGGEARAGIDLALPPTRLRRAVAEPGTPVTARSGNSAVGLIVVPLPVERLWKSVNDTEHHPRIMPIRASTILDGPSRGRQRRIFQYFQRWGIGRWWVNRVTMNAELYEHSNGRLWELRWRDDPRPSDLRHPAVVPVASRVRSIEASRGAWLMLSLGERCTLVEFATTSRPGGLLGVLQRPLVQRAVRDTLDSLVSMAGDHIGRPHPGPPFLRPDGTSLDSTDSPN